MKFQTKTDLYVGLFAVSVIAVYAIGMMLGYRIGQNSVLPHTMTICERKIPI